MKQATRKLTALDTNVLARYYVQAEQADAATTAQCAQARALLESGKPLFVATTVALELEWVLRGFTSSNQKLWPLCLCTYWKCPTCKYKTATPCKALAMP